MSIRRRTPRNYPEKRIAGLKCVEKLTVDDVNEIRRCYRHHSRDANCRVLAERFGVSTTTIHNIVREKKWRFDDWYFQTRSSERRNIPRSFLSHQSTAFGCASLEKCYQSLFDLGCDDPDLFASYERFSEWKMDFIEGAKQR